jgi:hypothetical protein
MQGPDVREAVLSLLAARDIAVPCLDGHGDVMPVEGARASFNSTPRFPTSSSEFAGFPVLVFGVRAVSNMITSICLLRAPWQSMT